VEQDQIARDAHAPSGMRDRYSRRYLADHESYATWMVAPIIVYRKAAG